LRPTAAASLVATLLTLSNSSAGASAAEPWRDQPFTTSPAILLPAARAAAGSGDARVVVLLDEGTETFEADDSVTVRYHSVYRIQRAGFDEGWSAVSVAYAPGRDDRPAIRVRVVSEDGTERLLDPKTIDEAPVHAPSPEMYSDRRVLRAPLPGVAPGAVVETEIIRHDRSPVPGAGSVRRFTFGNGVPVQRTQFIVDAPRRVPLRFAVIQLEGLQPVRTTTGDRVRLSFEKGPLRRSRTARSPCPRSSPRRRRW